MLRLGVSGATVAAALLATNQSFINPAILAARGGSPWESDKLNNGDANAIKRKADNDRDFRIIADYFGSSSGRNWRFKERGTGRILKNSRRQGDGYWEIYKNPGDDELAYVYFVKNDGGKEVAEAKLWRRGRFTDRFYVLNGNLRRGNGGRIDGQAAAMQAEPGANEYLCAADAVACGIGVGGGCIVSTAYTGLYCILAGNPDACSLTEFIVGGCISSGGTINDWCREGVGEECQ